MATLTRADGAEINWEARGKPDPLIEPLADGPIARPDLMAGVVRKAVEATT
jgi:hypothetical protein